MRQVRSPSGVSKYDPIQTGELVPCKGCGLLFNYMDIHVFEVDGREIKLCRDCCPRCDNSQEVEVIFIP